MIKETIVITGANSGIGLESVKQFLASGYQVAAISKNLSNLINIESDELTIYTCDVTDYSCMQKVIADILIKNGMIHGLINNAGVAFYDEFFNIDHDKIDLMLEVNIKGLTNVLELVLPNMQTNKLGTIINISSLADRNPRPKSAVYAATKAYVRSISDSLRLANAKYNIRVTNVAPALIETPLLKKVHAEASGIGVEKFVEVLKFIYQQPQTVCIRDLVIAPTNYEN
ncbi:MAG: SDR family oxidoreductase [Burkholderiales bacterium]